MTRTRIPADTIILSRAYSTRAYRYGRGITAPRYYAAKGRDRCDECVARAHEDYSAGGDLVGVRSVVRERRTIADDATRTLLLCGAHAELWRERDANDGAPVARRG